MVQNTTTRKLHDDLVLGLSDEALSTSANGWPFQIVNLLNMKPFDLVRFSNFINIWFILAHQNFDLSNDAVLNEGDKQRILETLEKAREELNYIGLEQSAKYVSTVRRHLSSSQIKTYGEYVVQVDAIHDMSINETEGIVFGFLPRSHGAYFNQDALFGSEVNDKFRGAAYDIKEAGNCYAHGTYTACVFHLMRVLEIALHKLAGELAVTFPATIDLENWQNIIEKIESEIAAREKRLPKGVAKSEEMQHYSEAAKEFRYFKNAWRNHVSHSRVDYEIHDATKIMEHVRDFMQHLATR